MDFNEVNELFDLYVPDVDFQPLSSETEKFNFIPDFSTLVALTIAFSFFIIFLKLKHRWIVNAKCSFCKCIGRVWRGELHWWFCNQCQRINGIPKDSSLILDSTLRDEQLEKMAEGFSNLKNKISNKRRAVSDNGESPVKKYEKNNYISYSENDFNKSSVDLDNLSKIMHKKLLRDDMSMRYELLNAERKLCMKMKQVKELERTLRNVKENSAIVCRRLESEINLNRSNTLASRKRTSFFDKTFDYSDGDSNFGSKHRIAEDLDMTKFQMSDLEEQINQLKAKHLNEVILLRDEINEKEETIRKLEELNKEIIELYQLVQRDNKRLKGKEANRFIKLQELALIKDRHEQASKDIAGLGNNLSKELEKINNLKSLFNQDFKNKSEMSTIIEEDVPESQHQISDFESNLKNFKEKSDRAAQHRENYHRDRSHKLDPTNNLLSSSTITTTAKQQVQHHQRRSQLNSDTTTDSSAKTSLDRDLSHNHNHNDRREKPRDDNRYELEQLNSGGIINGTKAAGPPRRNDLARRTRGARIVKPIRPGQRPAAKTTTTTTTTAAVASYGERSSS